MANTNHKDLTGVSLHEPKGAAAASAAEVFIADGAASGSFVKEHPHIAIMQYQESNGVNGDAYSTSWSKVPINTEVYDPESFVVSLTSSVITLPAGTYFFKGSCLWYNNQVSIGLKAACRMYDATAAAELTKGISAFSQFTGGNDAAHQTMTVSAIHVPTSQNTYEFQAISNSTLTTFGVHDGMTTGNEVFAILEIWKLA